MTQAFSNLCDSYKDPSFTNVPRALHITHSAHSLAANWAVLIMPWVILQRKIHGMTPHLTLLLFWEQRAERKIAFYFQPSLHKTTHFTFYCFRREMMTSSVSLLAVALAFLVAQQGCTEASLMGRGSKSINFKLLS